VSDEQERARQTAADVMRAAYRRAELVIEALPAREAYAAASALADMLRALSTSAAALRARMAARVRAEENLSVRALAELLQVSRSKAGELVARGARTDGD
jgi:type IV secretory pathway ATPase VirB11/archaellum biosynthesis ATPase